MVEHSGPYFITQSPGFDVGVVSVFDSESKDSRFKPRQLLNQKLMNWATKLWIEPYWSSPDTIGVGRITVFMKMIPYEKFSESRKKMFENNFLLNADLNCVVVKVCRTVNPSWASLTFRGLHLRNQWLPQG